MITREDIEALDDENSLEKKEPNLEKNIYTQIETMYGVVSEENIRKFWKTLVKGKNT